MKLIIAGLGPGDSNLITVSALNEAKNSDLILIPKSHKNNVQGVAEKILRDNLPEKSFISIYFPMIKDSKKRDEIIFEQIQNIKSKIEISKKIFFPVIGDSLLYSTGAYLIEALKKFFNDIDVNFIPGISAHSLAASCAKKFLAMSDEIFSVIPGTAEPEKIKAVLENSDSAAIYKPTAIKNIKELINENYEKIIRVDFAGIPDKEKIYEGEKALENINEYLSIILLWHKKNTPNEYKKLIEMANFDYVTKLSTRWYLQEYIKTLDDEFTCIYFDLDNFKSVNDTFGHQEGDKVLAETAGIIKNEFSDGFAARTGGDEFLVILKGQQDIKIIEERIKKLQTKNLTISAGISQKLKTESKTFDEIIRESDTALHEAKKTGRGIFKIHQ